ncbi:MAG: transcriptional repressor [Spirochaetaceae bacterium]|jgi:Fe2+ or Zn2+ uptake regulation protein|nr:transcriptional repressor [Spirochaetaceae bacterium]
MDFIRRKTKQRELVFNAIRALDHPTAQEAYAYIMRTTDFSTREAISIGTVYRNIQVLEQEGKIISVMMENQGPVRYDDRLDAHQHLHCESCGRVVDVPFVYDYRLDAEVERQSGCKIESHCFLFKGLCKDCLVSMEK